MPDQYAALFKALSTPSRTRILHLLAKHGELSVEDLTNRVKLAGPTVSRHLQVLRMQDLVNVRRDAQNRYYSLNKAHLIQRLRSFLKYLRIETPIT